MLPKGGLFTDLLRKAQAEVAANAAKKEQERVAALCRRANEDLAATLARLVGNAKAKLTALEVRLATAIDTYKREGGPGPTPTPRRRADLANGAGKADKAALDSAKDLDAAMARAESVAEELDVSAGKGGEAAAAAAAASAAALADALNGLERESQRLADAALGKLEVLLDYEIKPFHESLLGMEGL